MGYLSCKIGSAIVESHRRDPRALPPPQTFLFKDLELATNGFSPSSLLGKGSHGCVYLAVLKNGSHVAVKRPSYGRRMLQDEAAFDNEIRVLSALNNPRFVRLLGVCHDADKEKLLVVELMHNGTLYDLLHENLDVREAVGWSKRVDIALQIAKAVLDIHSFSPPLIHRDIKSSNIFMDRHWNAKLGDFGLALYSNSVSIAPAGTLGYLDPEYTTPDMLSTKNDVFSFGILLLEIISGRNAIDVHYNPPGIVEWAVPLIKSGRTIDICDPKVQPPRNISFLRRMAILAVKCVRDKSTRRPDMNHVVEQLQEVSNSIGFSVFNGIAHRMMTQDCKSDAHHHTTCHKKGSQRSLRVYDESRSLFYSRGPKLKTSISPPNHCSGDSLKIKLDDGGTGPPNHCSEDTQKTKLDDGGTGPPPYHFSVDSLKAKLDDGATSPPNHGNGVSQKTKLNAGATSPPNHGNGVSQKTKLDAGATGTSESPNRDVDRESFLELFRQPLD